MTAVERKGFTLIELLVVISIIALLMSILMPAMGIVKKKARAVVCMSNLSQWGKIWAMYATDHDDKLISRARAWARRLENYYKNDKLLLCPMATRVHVTYSSLASQGNGFRGDVSFDGRDPFAAWYDAYTDSKDDIWGSPPKADPTNEDQLNDKTGSYGINGWCVSEQYAGSSTVVQYDPSLDANGGRKGRWDVISVRGGEEIPLMCDIIAAMVSGDNLANYNAPADIGAYQKDRAPERADASEEVQPNEHEIGRACTPRHPKQTSQFVMMDLSVRAVKMREIWRLRWHRQWPRDPKPPNAWPEWMDPID